MTNGRSAFKQKAMAGLAQFRDEATKKIASILGRTAQYRKHMVHHLLANRWSTRHHLWMDADGVNEVVTTDPEDEDSVISVLSESLIESDDEEYVDWEEIDEYCDEPPEGEPEMDGYELGATVIAEFLRNCYKDAGGIDHPLPASPGTTIAIQK